MRLSPVLYELVRAFSKNANPCDNERTRAAVININVGLRFGWVSDRTHQQLACDGRVEPSRRTSAMGVAGAPGRIDSHKAREKLPAPAFNGGETPSPSTFPSSRNTSLLPSPSQQHWLVFSHPNQHFVPLPLENVTKREDALSRVKCVWWHYMWVI